MNSHNIIDQGAQVFGPHLRTPEMQAYTGIPRQTWAKLRCVGGGPAFIKVGATVIYDRRDVDAWLAQRKAGSCAQVFEQRASAQRKVAAVAAPDVPHVKRRGRPSMVNLVASATSGAAQ